MNKPLKIAVIVFLSILGFIFCVLLYLTTSIANIKLEENKLLNQNRAVVYLDDMDNEIFTCVNGVEYTSINEVPKHVINAFIAVEDKRFYSHKGVDYKGFIRAMSKNIKSFSFKEGGSTITQQLVKNTQLTNQKTVKRKLTEMGLARKIEKRYKKEQILEMYLNSIYFGEGNYGISSASKYYFSKEPKDLTITEGATLAGLIKSPLYLSPNRDINKSNSRKNVVLRLMFEQGYLDKETYYTERSRFIVLPKTAKRLNKSNGYIALCNDFVEEIISKNPYVTSKFIVKTNLNSNTQKILEKSILETNKPSNDYSLIVMDKNSKIKGFCSSSGEFIRQPGSIIKPIISYAPAIEYDLVDACTKIDDSFSNINGYSPKNYNDKYYGNISIRDALKYSSNVCAVKLLNQVGIDKAKKFARNFGLDIKNSDESLRIALGSFENGFTLKQLTASYNVFSNNGYYTSPSLIQSVYTENGLFIYRDKQEKIKAISNETASIINNILENTVKSGTCKKLSYAKTKVYAKSGTVGNEKGNTDAYTISYNNYLTLGVWFGNSDSSYMPNSVTGGGLPCDLSRTIWDELSSSNDFSNDISKEYKEIEIDELAYEKEGKVLLAESFAPERYKLKEIFKSSRIPKTYSTTFSKPKIENANISFNSKAITIRLCLRQLYDFKVYKIENGVKTLVYDSKGNGKLEFTDNNVALGKKYTYSIIPYYQYDNNFIYGEEYFFKEIKMPVINGQNNDQWWILDL